MDATQANTDSAQCPGCAQRDRRIADLEARIAALEAKLQEDAAIERVVVIGDERPYVTALVVPDWERLKRQAGLSGEPEKLVEDPKAMAAVQKRVDALNSELGSWESIKYFTLLPADFNEESGEITPTLKVKRRAIQEHYKGAIDRMYQHEKPQGGRGAH